MKVIDIAAGCARALDAVDPTEAAITAILE